MTRYSIQPRDQTFVKGYAFLSFAKNMGKCIGKNISKNVSDKYSKKFLDHAKHSATDAFKTSSKRAIQKTAGGTGDLIGNKIANAVTKSYGNKIRVGSKSPQQNNSETVTNEHDNEIPKERYICPEERQELLMN